MEKNNYENNIEELATISANEARILYCSMEIQKLAVVLKESLLELEGAQKLFQLHDRIAKCIEEINFWSNPLVTCLCYEKNNTLGGTADEQTPSLEKEHTKDHSLQ